MIEFATHAAGPAAVAGLLQLLNPSQLPTAICTPRAQKFYNGWWQGTVDDQWLDLKSGEQVYHVT